MCSTCSGRSACANARHYILRYELKGGFHNLVHFHTRVTMRRSTKETLKDKLRFFRRCEKAGVASPRSCSRSRAPTAASRRRATRATDLPPHDLFIKPAKGKGGRGCEKWLYRDGRL